MWNFYKCESVSILIKYLFHFSLFLVGSHISHVPYLCRMELHIQNFVSQEKKLYAYNSRIAQHIKKIFACRFTFTAVLGNSKTMFLTTTPIPYFNFRSKAREVTVV